MSQTENNWDMLGHEWAVDLLKGHLTNDRIRHAYLFTGPKGVGRRTLAIRLAQSLNCQQPVSPGKPCGDCRACRLISRMEHPDLIIIAAEHIGGTLKVDQIRELQRTLSLAPYEAQYKVAILLRFEEANPSAANALLKTLEEPPPNVVLMLTASDGESLLPTIVSRCELIRLRPLSIDQVSEGLQARWGLPVEEADLLAHISGGRPGYAYTLSQNPDLLTLRQTQIEDHFNLLSSSRTSRFDYADTLAKDKSVSQGTLQTWTSLWRDVMLSAGGSTAPLVNIDHTTKIDALANQIGLQRATQIVNLIEQTQTRLNRNTNTRLTLEVLMLDLPKI